MNDHYNIINQNFEEFDCGPHNVVESDGWETLDGKEFSKIVYAEVDEFDDNSDSYKISFTVILDDNFDPIEASALLMSNGSLINDIYFEKNLKVGM